MDKYTLITRNLQEHTDPDVLKKMLVTKNLNVYWGTATTGKPHLGYYVPLLKIRDLVLADCEVTILLADIHAFLDNLKAPIDLVQKRCDYYEKLLKQMLISIDVDPCKIKFIRGSEFQLSQSYVFDLLKLATLTTQRNAIKAGAQVVKQVENPLLSSMIYPLMQALDEEYLKSDCELGGADQRKIFMFARKYLPLLGYNKRIHLMTPMVPGLSNTATNTTQRVGENSTNLSEDLQNLKLMSNTASHNKDEVLKSGSQENRNSGSQHPTNNTKNKNETLVENPESDYSYNPKARSHMSSLSVKMSSSVESSKIDILDTKKQITTKITKCYLKPTDHSPLFDTIKQILLPIIEIKNRSFKITRKNQDDFVFHGFEDLLKAFHNEIVHPSDLKKFVSDEIDFILHPIRNNMEKEKKIVDAAYGSIKTKNKGV